ncbi:hypothetical protein [Psychromonas sp.]|uniref:hypothetical protein n=1 Tax=Psychromonas sp. TaxID=1884585 RepID=UPI003568BD71
MGTVQQYRGFAVLSCAVLLSMASIAFTVHMASIQLIDNQIVGNYYRNNEAFANAESGINLVLSKIDDPAIGPGILASITSSSGPTYTYRSEDNHYNVQISRINRNTLQISSVGRSIDDTAQRTISLQIYHETRYNLPNSPLAANGKVNLDGMATVNNGCEGLSAADCRSPGNIADYQLVSNPKNEIGKTSGLCNGSPQAADGKNNSGINVIADNVFYEPLSADNSVEIGDYDAQGELITWSNTIPAGASFYGETVAADLQPDSLFESTFGVSKEAGVAALNSSTDVAKIDMTDADFTTSCSERLEAIQQFTPEVDTIYIKGYCDIEQNYAAFSAKPENKRFTIGTVDHPKLVFIEGGTFVSKPNTGVSVIGMLYFVPATTVDATGTVIEDASVDMSGVRVNGALLSEYSCSHDGYDKTDNKGRKQHFSARYDKTVLSKLYEHIGQQPPVDTGYSIVQGSWRDF